jgi:hypothetical protein
MLDPAVIPFSPGGDLSPSALCARARGLRRGPALTRIFRITPFKPRAGTALIASGFAAALALLAPAPSAQAAEKIYISYDILERSVPLASLDTYAKTGTLDQDLAVYSKYAPPVELEKLKQILKSKAPISHIAVSQFLYSPQGELLLQQLGQVIQPASRIPGDEAIRAALILAAQDPVEGLTLLNVVRKFPSEGLRIDIAKSLEIVGQLEQAIRLTNQAAVAIAQQAERDRSGEQIALAQPRELEQMGRSNVSVTSLPNLVDAARPMTVAVAQDKSIPLGPLDNGRTLDVDLYVPQSSRYQGKTLPVIVISHGLGSDRSSFAYLAKHLASHGQCSSNRSLAHGQRVWSR